LAGIKAIKAAGRDELINHVWGKDATKAGLQALVDRQMTFTVQTPPTFGDLALKAFEDFKADKDLPPVIYTDPARYTNRTRDGIAAAKERIRELDDAGLVCC
jgi:ABC-type sugar transport system substrate-binding protein